MAGQCVTIKGVPGEPRVFSRSHLIEALQVTTRRTCEVLGAYYERRLQTVAREAFERGREYGRAEVEASQSRSLENSLG